MFAAAADGTILPPYTVYKAIHLYQSWTEGGPKNARYNRTKSGWFDSFCFEDWVLTVALPFLKKKTRRKILIGDNLSSHLSMESVKLCKDNDISFIFLPANSTHLTQPLDVAFFRPLKSTWRQILEEWKKGPGRAEATVPKDKFPTLLKKLCDSLKGENVIAGFKKCGLVPLNRNKVLSMLPKIIDEEENQNPEDIQKDTEAVDKSFQELLQSLRHDQTPKIRKKRSKVNVIPGKSIGVEDFVEDDENPQTSDSTGQNPGTKQVQSKKTRKEMDISSEDEDDISAQDSESTDSCDPEESDRASDENLVINEDDYLLVKVYGKTSFRCYICSIVI